VDGVGINLAGGTHHACADQGQGFCVFNDVAVAIRLLQTEGAIRRAVVVDCDVHQGNGTAAIFQGDSCVFTMSMHGAQNFPFRKTASDLDVALPDATTDDDYLRLLRGALEEALRQGDADCVFYLAGADAYEHDRLGRLKLTQTGLARRDWEVLLNCRARELPVTVVMAGGYAVDIKDTVEIHATTVKMLSTFAGKTVPGYLRARPQSDRDLRPTPSS
jgi:acetoin utilization deacetylase AcuC-like enzyme